MARKIPVGFLGGAFDPVHVGHVAMARYALAQADIERLIVAPCFAHPLGKRLLDFSHRLAMTQLAFAGIANVQVSDIEGRMSDVSYTADTLRALMKEDRTARFVLTLGFDAAETLADWHDADWLFEHAEIFIIGRGPGGPIPNVSSTDIRERCARGDAITDLVPAPVAAYIREHNLYRLASV